MSTKALVVEDDPRIFEVIEDQLYSLGHEFVWATNLYDARRVLVDGEFDYVLLDLEFPSKPNRGIGIMENGSLLLQEIQQLKGHKKLPVIIMSGHVNYCLNRSNKFRAMGASEFIAKPFSHESPTLTDVIRDVLSQHVFNSASVDSNRERKEFSGGELVFFEDRVELLGVEIMSDRGTGLTMTILKELCQQDSGRRYLRLSGEELAKCARALGGINSITGCIRRLRRNIVTRLDKHAGICVGMEDVIAHDEQGYYLANSIVSKEGGDSIGKATPNVPTVCPTVNVRNAELNERQTWVLAEIERGTHLSRAMLENRFDVGEKTAKRDLAELSRSGQIQFVREGRVGYYRLRKACYGSGKKRPLTGKAVTV